MRKCPRPVHGQTMWLGVIVATSVVLSGCRSTPRLEQKVADLFTAPEQLLSPEETGLLSISFEEICRRSARLNNDVVARAGVLPEREIDVEQAGSLAWPRFDLGARAQIAIDDGVDSGGDLATVGLYINYDIQRALFVSDGVSAARLGRQRAVEKLRLAVAAHVSRMYVELAELQFLEDSVVRHEAMREQARKALESARAFGEMGDVSPGAILGWHSRVAGLSDDLWQARQTLTQAKQSFASRVGASAQAECVVTDMIQTLSVPSSPVGIAPDLRGLVARVWHRRTECKLAELDVLLAELAIVDAKRKRLPRVSGSAGVGDVNALDEDDVPFVFELGVSVPLLDFGDIRRQVRKAEARRDAALERATLLARRVGTEAREAQHAFNRAAEGLQHAKTLRDAVADRRDAVKDLAEIGTAAPLSEARLELDRLQSDLRIQKALLELRKAWATHAATSGNDLQPGLVDGITAALCGGEDDADGGPGHD